MYCIEWSMKGSSKARGKLTIVSYFQYNTLDKNSLCSQKYTCHSLCSQKLFALLTKVSRFAHKSLLVTHFVNWVFVFFFTHYLFLASPTKPNFFLALL